MSSGNPEQTLIVMHPAYDRANIIVSILSICLIVVGVGLLFLLMMEIQRRSTTLTITNKVTRLRKGILSRSITEVRHKDVRNVSLTQSLVDRLLGIATISIGSSGQSGDEITVRGITQPDHVKKLISQHRD